MNSPWMRSSATTEGNVKKLLLRVHPDVLGRHGDEVRNQNLKSIQELSNLISITNEMVASRTPQRHEHELPSSDVVLPFFMECPDNPAADKLKEITLKVRSSEFVSPSVWERNFLQALRRIFSVAGITENKSAEGGDAERSRDRESSRATDFDHLGYARYQVPKSADDVMEDALVWGLMDGAPKAKMRQDLDERMLEPGQLEARTDARGRILEEIIGAGRIVVGAETRTFYGACPPVFQEQLERVHVALSELVPLTYLHRLASPLCSDMLIVLDTSRAKPGTLQGRCIVVGVEMNEREIADCISECIAVTENIVGRYTDLQWPTAQT